MAKSNIGTFVDVYQSVTDRILASLDKGVAPWIKPWDASGEGTRTNLQHHNVASRKPYRGINTLLLWIAGAGYTSTQWGTFKQWQDKGGMVRKGEKATRIVFFKEVIMKDRESDDPTKARKVLVLREYCVFCRDQVDGLKPEAAEPVIVRPVLTGLSDSLNAWFTRTGSDVRTGGTRAYYTPAGDHIQMPEADRFRSADDYYSTLAHEHAHWTGAKARLDRTLNGWKASPEYAYEELIAELSSAFTCARLGVNLTQLQHAEYLQSWSKGMREQKKMIVSAAAAAQKATDYLFGLAGDVGEATADDHDDTPTNVVPFVLDLGKPVMRFSAVSASIGLGGLGFTYTGTIDPVGEGSALGVPLMDEAETVMAESVRVVNAPERAQDLWDLIDRINRTHTVVQSFGRSDDGQHEAGPDADLPPGRLRTYRYIHETRGKRAANAYASRYRARQAEIDNAGREPGRYYIVTDAQLARDLRGRTHADVRREVAASISQRLSGRYQLGNQAEEYVQAMIDAGRVPSLAGAGTVAREGVTIGLKHERENAVRRRTGGIRIAA